MGRAFGGLGDCVLLSLTRKADYALVAMAELARRDPEQISARKLAEDVQVPLPVLTNILHQLLQHELVVSTRGAQGGYRLSRPAGQIALASVIEAVEGPVQLTMCCGDEEETDSDSRSGSCDLEDGCRIKAPLRRVQERFRSFLNQVDLAYIAYDHVPVSLGLPYSAGVAEKAPDESCEAGCSMPLGDWTQD